MQQQQVLNQVTNDFNNSDLSFANQLHPLEHSWTFYVLKRPQRHHFHQPNPNDKGNIQQIAGDAQTEQLQAVVAPVSSATNANNDAQSVDDYEKNIKEIGSFSTVEGFWQYYDYMVRPSDAPRNVDYQLFRGGIKPIWEDPMNNKGGKCSIRIKKDLQAASKMWENLLLTVIGESLFSKYDESFDPYEVCGVVISIRPTEFIISVWYRNLNNSVTSILEGPGGLVNVMFDSLKHSLDIPQNATFEHKRHDQSLQSSHTRTTVDQNNLKSNVDGNYQRNTNDNQYKKTSMLPPNSSTTGTSNLQPSSNGYGGRISRYNSNQSSNPSLMAPLVNVNSNHSINNNNNNNSSTNRTNWRGNVSTFDDNGSKSGATINQNKQTRGIQRSPW